MFRDGRALLLGLPVSLDVHSSLEPTWMFWVALIISFLVGGVANSAGVGGGAIYVPMLHYLVGFAGAAVGVAMNSRRSSPVDPTQCIIDLQIAMILTPVLLIGVSLGVLLNVVFPDWLLSMLLLLLMVALIIDAVTKGIHLWRHETCVKRCQRTQQSVQLRSLGLDEYTSLDSLEGGTDPGQRQQERHDQQRTIPAAMALEGATAAPGPTNGAAAVSGNLCNAPAAGLPARSRAGGHPAAQLPCVQEGWVVSLASLEGVEVPTTAPPLMGLPEDESRWGDNQAPSADVESGLWRPVRRARSLTLDSRGNAQCRPLVAAIGEQGQGAGGTSWLMRRSAWRRTIGLNEFGSVLPDEHYGLERIQPLPENLFVQHSHVEPRRYDNSGRSSVSLADAEKVSGSRAQPSGVAGQLELLGVANSTRGLLLTSSPSSASVGSLRQRAADRATPTALSSQAASADMMAGGGGSSTGSNAAGSSTTANGGAARDNGDFEDGSSGAPVATAAAAAAAGLTATSPAATANSPAARLTGWLASHLAARQSSSYSLTLLAVWAVFVGWQMLKTFSQACSPAFWAAFVLQISMMLGASYAVSGWMIIHHGRSAKLAVAPPSTAANRAIGLAFDLAWHNLARCMLVTMLAGLIGGLLGLGGGMVMSPLLLHLGIHPQVTAATSGTMVLFSSSAAMLQYAAMGMLNWQYALVFGAISMISTLAGVHVISRLIRQSGRTSIAVFALTLVMGIGGVCVAMFGMQAAVKDLSAKRVVGFNSICSRG